MMILGSQGWSNIKTDKNFLKKTWKNASYIKKIIEKLLY